MGKGGLAMNGELMLYLHLPFCKKKCLYCDFLSGRYSQEERKAYLSALKREIAWAAEREKGRRVTSVFLGGGTPSLLSGEEMEELMEEVFAHFPVEKGAEISMEGNPGTFTRENLRRYRLAGINRLSIGCQSVKDAELKVLGRIHSHRDFLEGFSWAREAGFEELNVDLMFALPGQSLADWEENLETVARLSPEHISAYSLILEEGTPFASMDLALPDEDVERRMYERTEEVLADYGFLQYEISNYALPGRECRHNTGYWQRRDYLGLGVGAASLLDGVRWSNIGNFEEYVKGSLNPETLQRDVQRLSRREKMEEFMFLGLRLRRGVSREVFFREFGQSMEEVYGRVLDKFEGLGLMRREGDWVFLTRAGIHVSNRIFVEMLL